MRTDATRRLTFLPPWRREVNALYLPLQNCTVGSLIDAFLAESPQHGHACFRAALADDPAFLLWTAHLEKAFHPTLSPNDRVPDFSQLCSFLTQSGVGLLQWPAENKVMPSEKEWVARKNQWSRLTYASLAVANCAQQRAQSLGSRAAEQAYILGALHNADAWLQAAFTIPAGAVDSFRSFLPSWLGKDQTDLVSEGVRDCVQHAQNDMAAAWKETPHDAPSSLDDDCNLGARLAVLTARLNRLEDLEYRFSATVQQEKLTALYNWAYGASHEINNPLTNISTRAQTLLEDETQPQRKRNLAMIVAEAMRAHEMIADMMLFAKPPQVHLSPVDLEKLIRRTVEQISEEAQRQGTKLIVAASADRASLADEYFVQADPVQMAEAIRALLLNSLEALQCGGEICCSLRRADDRTLSNHRLSNVKAKRHPWIELLVEDNGPGIPLDKRLHIFDPFYCGREAGRGIGMGLSKCWRILHQHSGHIRLVEERASGCAFSLLVPAARQLKSG